MYGMNSDQFIYIDNERVFVNELSNRQKYLVSQISDIQAKLTQVQFNADQLNVALNFFSEELNKSRNKVEPVVA